MKAVRKTTYSLCLLMIIPLLQQPICSFDGVAATQINNYHDEHGQYCNGSFAEELQTESETGHRRFLGGNKYISPGVLKPDQPACGKAVRGEPYRSCLPPPANRPNRGCNTYDRCRK